jgi:hypothetical protein
MKMINSKHSESRVIIMVLLSGIALVLFALVINLYFIFNNVSKNDFSDMSSEIRPLPSFLDSNFTQVKFSLKSIICGNGDSKYIRTFVSEIAGNGNLIGIKFIAKDKNGKEYSYTNYDLSALPNFQSRERTIDVMYSQLGVNSAENIVLLEATPILRGLDGKETFGDATLSPEVCYSSCNDCTTSCELICTVPGK